MPATSLDTFANTNPAFCALVLRAFVEGFLQGDGEGVPLPHVVLPLPIVLSADLAATFAGTNATTGLLTWVGRHPHVTLELRERVTTSACFSREALLFGVTRRVLGVNDRGLERLEAQIREPRRRPRARFRFCHEYPYRPSVRPELPGARSRSTCAAQRSLRPRAAGDADGTWRDESYLSGHVATLLALHRVFDDARPVPASSC
jgi:hypothetical protein